APRDVVALGTSCFIACAPDGGEPSDVDILLSRRPAPVTRQRCSRHDGDGRPEVIRLNRLAVGGTRGGRRCWEWSGHHQLRLRGCVPVWWMWAAPACGREWHSCCVPEALAVWWRET